MRKILVIILVVSTVTVFEASGVVAISQYFWRNDRIFQERIEEINKRIKETEERMWSLDAQQISDRIEWVNWGIDILQQNQEDLMREMEKERKRMEEARENDSDWEIWESYGRKFNKLERKKDRLNTILGRLKNLRDRLKGRLREVKGIPEYKPFRLGLGIGSLNFSGPVQITEGKLRTPVVDFFYGSDGENTEGKKNWVRTNYYGIEKPLGNFQLMKAVTCRIPVGLEKFSFREGILPCAGIAGEFRYRNAKQEWMTAFGQVRWGFGQDSVVTLLVGLFL